MKTMLITNQDDLDQAFTIRKEVFVREQGVPLSDEFDEFDHLEANCKHILVLHQGQAVGTGRIRTLGDTGKLERICVLEAYRKYGIGRLIIDKLESIARNEGLHKVKLHGQTQAEGFYHKLNYVTSSDMFMEDGIPHVLLTKRLSEEK